MLPEANRPTEQRAAQKRRICVGFYSVASDPYISGASSCIHYRVEVDAQWYYWNTPRELGPIRERRI